MAKRKVATTTSDDEGSTYGSSAAAPSDSDDYEPEPKPSTAKARRVGSAPVRGRARKTVSTRVPPTTTTTTSAKTDIPHGVMRHVLAAANAETIASTLLTWFATVCTIRGMPWRKPYDPTLSADERSQRAYEVWISEIMLQQTQVATVIPYYNRWMDKFPTLKDLAAGSIDEVHALWKGLGYYSRASRLLEGAQKVMNTSTFQSRLPANAERMQADMPGVGRYSAGAICSIAYGEQVPVLDGNVNRLLSRVLALHAPPKSKATTDLLWAGATALVSAPIAKSAPGDLNQALIELGSTVCKPKSPNCSTCPLKPHCRAYALQSGAAKPSILDLMKGASARQVMSTVPKTNAQVDAAVDVDVADIEELCGLCESVPGALTVEAFPMRAEKKKAREETDIVRVIEWRARPNADVNANAANRWFLLVKRPEGGLLGGLEEFPSEANVVDDDDSTDEESAHTAIQRLLVDTIAPASSPKAESTARADTDKSVSSEQLSNPLHVARFTCVGDVQHIFSHIRKTYRVQWVVLQGGGDAPPDIRPQTPSVVNGPRGPSKAKSETSGRALKKRRSVKGKDKEVIDVDEEDASTSTPSGSRIRWILKEQVSDANISTGVVKIWDRVRALW